MKIVAHRREERLRNMEVRKIVCNLRAREDQGASAV
jgi:hypothetical protein